MKMQTRPWTMLLMMLAGWLNKKVSKDLLDYCKLNTLAKVRLYESLEGLIEAKVI